ncbi:hypothetical protein [Cypionkella sp.]|jgi:flagellar biosynthesis GTPase FlhF|uniref:hypothetical protein n=1 Tax=Cypionkella sp. TaxID=2811411 RepID=UPI002FDCAB6D
MPTITVTAPDSALAMDEIMRRLGDGAFILSTKSHNGQIEIRATNDPLPVKNDKPEKADKQSFGELFAKVGFADEHFVLNRPRSNAPHPQAGDKTLSLVQPPEEAKAPSNAVHVTLEDPVQSALAPSKPPHNDSSTAFLEGMFDKIRSFDAVREGKIEDLRRRLERAIAGVEAARAAADFAEAEARALETAREQLQSEVRELTAALVATKEAHARIGEEDALLATGFDAQLVGRLTAAASGNRHLDFASGLAREIAAAQSQLSSVLEGGGLVVAGPSGAGKSHLAAKFAALLKLAFPESRVQLVSVPYQFDNITLSGLARQIGIDHSYLEIEDLSDLSHFDPDLRLVLDINLTGAQLGQLRPQRVGKEPLPVVLAMPAGQSLGRINQTLAHYEGIASQIALTKLDEYECDAAELCAYATSTLPVGWLSGTQDIEGTLNEASVEVFRDYIIGLLPEQSPVEATTQLAAE